MGVALSLVILLAHRHVLESPSGWFMHAARRRPSGSSTTSSGASRRRTHDSAVAKATTHISESRTVRDPLYASVIGLTGLVVMLQGLWAGLLIREGKDFDASSAQTRWVKAHDWGGAYRNRPRLRVIGRGGWVAAGPLGNLSSGPQRCFFGGCSGAPVRW